MNKLYFYKFDSLKIGETLCSARNKEIESTANEKLKAQKFYAWKTLEFAVKHGLNLSPKKIDFRKNENGKWVCNEFYFSLSHSENFVAVAISNSPIGVDIQIKKDIDYNSLSKKILTNHELDYFSQLPNDNKQDYIFKKWTEKESLFKLKGERVCHYKSLVANDFNLVFKLIKNGGLNYYLTAVFEDKNKVDIEEITVLTDL